VITNYYIRWNQGATKNIWADLASVTGPTSTYTATSLTPGEIYYFTIEAENIHGKGIPSAIFQENAAQKPDTPAKPITSE